MGGSCKLTALKCQDTAQCRHLSVSGVDTRGGHTYGRTDGLTDQPTRLREFHMLYGTKKCEVCSRLLLDALNGLKSKSGRKKGFRPVYRLYTPVYTMCTVLVSGKY